MNGNGNGSKVDYLEYLAILISGICLGWLEKASTGDQTGEILEAILAIIASSTVLGKTFTGKKIDVNASFLKNLLFAEKSAWPLAILLIGIVLGVVIGHFLKF